MLHNRGFHHIRQDSSPETKLKT